MPDEKEYVLKLKVDTSDSNKGLDQTDRRLDQLKQSFKQAGSSASQIGAQLTQGLNTASNAWSNFAQKMTTAGQMSGVAQAQAQVVNQAQSMAQAQTQATRAVQQTQEALSGVTRPLREANTMSSRLASIWQSLTTPAGFTSKEAENIRAQIIRINDAANSESAKVEERIRKLKQAMEDVGNTKIPTDAWKEHLKELDAAEKKVKDIENFMKSGLEFAKESAVRHGESAEAGASRYLGSPGYKESMKRQQEAMEAYKAVEAKGQKLIDNGEAFKDMTETTRYQNLNRDLEEAQGRLNDISETSYNQVMELEQQLSSIENSGWTQLQTIGAGIIANIARGIGSAFKSALSTVVNWIKRAGSALWGLTKQFVQARIHNNLFAKALNATANAFSRFVRMLRVRITNKFITSLYSSISEAFKSLKEVSPEFSSAISRISASVKALGAQIVAIIEPVITAVEPFVTWLLDKLTLIADKVAQFSARLFGNDTYTQAKKSIDETTESTEDLTKATKDYQNSVLGFDKLNKLGGSSSSSSGSDDLAAELEKAETAKSKLNELADAIKDAWDAGDWAGVGKGLADLVNYGFGSLKEWADNVDLDEWTKKFHNFAQAVNEFGKNFDAKGAGEAIGSFITLLVKGWSALLDDPENGGIDFKLIGQNIGKMLGYAAKNIPWDEVGANIVKSIQAFVKTINGFLETEIIDDETKESKTIGRVLGESLGAIFKGAVDALKPKDWADLVVNLIKNFCDFIIGFFGDFEAVQELGEKLAEAINEIFAGMDGKQLAETVNALTKGFNTLVSSFFGNINTSQIIAVLSDALGNIDFGELGTMIGTLMGPQLITGLLGSLGNGAKGLLGIWIRSKLLKHMLGLGGGGAGVADVAGGAGTSGGGLLSNPIAVKLVGATAAAVAMWGGIQLGRYLSQDAIETYNEFKASGGTLDASKWTVTQHTGAFLIATIDRLTGLFDGFSEEYDKAMKDFKLSDLFSGQTREGEQVSVYGLGSELQSSLASGQTREGEQLSVYGLGSEQQKLLKDSSVAGDGSMSGGDLFNSIQSMVTAQTDTKQAIDDATGQDSDVVKALTITNSRLAGIATILESEKTTEISVDGDVFANAVEKVQAKKDKEQNALGLYGSFGWINGGN